MDQTASGFQVSLPGFEASGDVLGVWQAQLAPPPPPKRPAGAFDVPALGASGKPVDEIPATVWRVNLPRDPRQAADLLAAQEWRLAQAEQALPQAEQRLERYIEIRKRSQAAGSFALGRRTGPEAWLDDWLGSNGPASFGGIPGFPDDWEATLSQASALLKHLGQTSAYAAWVETASAGKLVGRTTVAWDGDLRHIWLQGASAQQVGQHERSLTLSLRSRLAWIKMTMLVLSGGLKLAVLAPAGPLGSIPAALQFFLQIIAQAQEIQAVQAENQ